MEPVQTTDPTAKTGGPAAPVVASGSAPSQAPALPVGNGAMGSVPKFGGNRGGRPRDDGLVPGSPEAKEADRAKDSRRQADYRARKRAANPPALPANLPGASDQVKTLAVDQGAMPDSSLVPWLPENLKPLLDEWIPVIEQADVRSLTKKASDGKLPAALLKEIETDARWPQACKSAYSNSGARVGAKWLNEFGISADYKDEAVLLLALVSHINSRQKLSGKIDELIIEMKKAKEAQPEVKKS